MQYKYEVHTYMKTTINMDHVMTIFDLTTVYTRQV